MAIRCHGTSVEKWRKEEKAMSKLEEITNKTGLGGSVRLEEVADGTANPVS